MLLKGASIVLKSTSAIKELFKLPWNIFTLSPNLQNSDGIKGKFFYTPF